MKHNISDNFIPASREQVFAHVLQRYGTTPEYLWRRHPTYAVLRHSTAEGGKWYAVVMDIPPLRLGLVGDEKVDVLNLKCGADVVDLLLAEPGVYPAWHMNKDHWVSVLLAETSLDAVGEWLERSFQLTLRKRSRKV